MSTEPQYSVKHVWMGFGLALLFPFSGLLLWPVMAVLSPTFQRSAWVSSLVGVVGLLVYAIIPAVVIKGRSRWPGIGKGFIIGISLIVLLVAACFGFFIFSSRGRIAG